MDEREDEALGEVVEAHSDVTFDLGTPRQYTGHGEWNQSCGCGHLFGSQSEVDAGWSEHIAASVLASDWLAAHVRARVAEALAPIEALADEIDRYHHDCARRIRAALPAPDPQDDGSRRPVRASGGTGPDVPDTD